MNTDQTFRNTLLLLGLILLFTAFFLALLRLDTLLKYVAFNNCSKISRYEEIQGGKKFSYPVVDFYEKCLKRVGFK